MGRSRATTAAPSTSGYLLVAASLLAIAVGYSPFGVSQPTDLPLLSLGLVVAISALLPLSAAQASALVRWRFAWAAVGFSAWMSVSALVSGRIVSALTGVFGSMLGWLTIAGIVVAVLSASVRRSTVRHAFLQLAPFVLAVELGFVGFEIARGRHPAGTLSNTSFLAEIVVFLLPLVAARALASTRLLERVVLWALTALGVALPYVADARAAALAVFIAVTFAAFVALRRHRGWSRGAAAAAVVGVAAAVVGAQLVVGGPQRVRGDALGFFSDRMRFWGPGWDAVLSRPVFGHGADGFRDALWSTATGSTVEGTSNFGQISADPHNALLWVAVSGGLVGLAFMLWMMGEAARNWTLQARAGAVGELWPFSAGLLMYGLTVLTAPAALQTLPLFALVLGASLRIESSERSGRGVDVSSLGARSARIVAAALAIALLLLAFTRLSIARADRPNGANAAYSQSLADLWRVDPFLYYRASLDWGFAAQRDPALLASRADLSAIRRAVALEPSNPVYATELARTLAYHGEPAAEVLAAFDRAEALFPGSPDVHSSRAEYLLFLRDYPAARRELDLAARAAATREVLAVNASYYRAIGDAKNAALYEAQIAAYDEVIASLVPTP